MANRALFSLCWPCGSPTGGRLLLRLIHQCDLMRFLLTYFDNQIIKCYKYLIDVQADIVWGWVARPHMSVGGKHHYNDAALLLTKQMHFFFSKLATVNTIDVASRFHYNTLLFQLMTNFFSKI